MEDRIPGWLQHYHKMCCKKGSHCRRWACMFWRWFHCGDVISGQVDLHMTIKWTSEYIWGITIIFSIFFYLKYSKPIYKQLECTIFWLLYTKSSCLQYYFIICQSSTLSINVFHERLILILNSTSKLSSTIELFFLKPYQYSVFYS